MKWKNIKTLLGSRRREIGTGEKKFIPGLKLWLLFQKYRFYEINSMMMYIKKKFKYTERFLIM